MEQSVHVKLEGSLIWNHCALWANIFKQISHRISCSHEISCGSKCAKYRVPDLLPSPLQLNQEGTGVSVICRWKGYVHTRSVPQTPGQSDHTFQSYRDFSEKNHYLGPCT